MSITKRERKDWWSSDHSKAVKAKIVKEVFERLTEKAQYRHSQYLEWLSYYEGKVVQSLSPETYHSQEYKQTESENAIRSAAKAVRSKTKRNSGGCVFKPDGANPNQRRTVRRVNDYVEGLIQNQGLRDEPYEKKIIDALVCGCGLTREAWEKPVDGTDRADVMSVRLLPWHLLYDSADCEDGTPPGEIYIARLIPREELLLRYEKHRGAIETLKPSASAVDTSACTGKGARDTIQDRIRVVECYRRSICRGHAGSYVAVATEGELLLEEREYVHQAFPITALVWEPATVGWILEGQSFVQEQMDNQRKANDVGERIDEGFHLAPHALVPDSIDVTPPKKFTNDKRFKVLPAGFKIVHGQPTTQFHLDYHQRKLDAVYKYSGVSQLGAQSMKPSGVTAAVAMQALEDVESDYFHAFLARAAAMWVTLGRNLVRASNDAKMAGYKVETTKDHGDYIETLVFDDFIADESQFSIFAQPISKKPRGLSGQMSAASEGLANGLFDTREARQLLDLPDLEQTRKISDAPMEAVQLDVDDILEEGKPRLPDSKDDLQYAIQYATSRYLLARRYVEDLEDDNESKELEGRLKLLDQYMEQAESLLQPQPQGSPDGTIPTDAAEPGAAEPPPDSTLAAVA